MNSIKNAIVTITLLVVGYGSYLVLQNPPEDGKFQEFAVNNAHDPSLTHPSSETSSSGPGERNLGDDLDLKIELGDAPELAASSSDSTPVNVLPLLPPTAGPGVASDAVSSPSQRTTLAVVPDVPEPPADDSRFSGYEGEFAESFVESPGEPPSPELVIPEEGVFRSSPGPDPNTGPFAAPIVVAVSPTDVEIDLAPDLKAAADAAIPKADTSNVATIADLGAPEINDSFGPIPPADSESNSAFEDAWMAAQQQLRDRDLVTALSALSPWAADLTLSNEQRSRCLQSLDQLAGTVIYSREHHLEPEYVVQVGETLDELASRYNVPQDLLAKINGIAPPYALTTGEILKLVRGPFRAEVSLFKSKLTLYLGANYAGRFPVTIGPDLPPEEAIYEVAEKSDGRSYFDRRTGNEVLRGDASNRYGNHWLGLRGEHITTGHSVGIHGRPIKYVGENVGSISLDPLDAEDVFSILSVGSGVQVVR